MIEKGTILAVDDTPESLRMLEEILGDEHYLVRPADSGSLALASAEASPPDLILLDIYLPDIDGFEVCRLLKRDERTRAIPVIFLSASTDPAQRVEGLHLGAVDFISKPFQRDELLARVRLHMELGVLRNRQEALVAERTEELRHSEERLKLATRAAKIGVWDWDVTKNNLVWDEKMYALYGVSKDTFQPTYTAWLESVHPDDTESADCAIQAALRGEQEYSLEFRIVWPDGSVHFIQALSETIQSKDGKPLRMIGTNMEITARKQDEQNLRQAKEAAEAANQSKDQFLAMLSHELRTPLTPILGGLNALEDRIKGEEKQTLAMMRRNIILETRLIDDLLDLTRCVKKQLTVSLRPSNVHRVIRDALETCQPAIAGRYLIVACDATEHRVNADPIRLQQVICNLLQNAARFTGEKGTIEIRTTNPAPGVVRISCRDNGRGIEPNDLNRIFQPFEQCERSVEAGYGGLGLGLAISKALVEAQNGTIIARSAGRGTGAMFEVTLPVVSTSELGSKRESQPRTLPVTTHFAAPMSASEVGKLSGSAAASGSFMPRDPGYKPTSPRILFVEDNTDTRETLERLFKRIGYRIYTAPDARTARKLAENRVFDLFISDIGLPDESGLELVRAVHERQAIPAIALSGFGALADVKKSLDAGFTEHLVKPVDFTVLKEAVDRLRPS